MNRLHSLDWLVFFIYFIVVTAYGYYIYQRKKSRQLSSQEFFLAEGSLTWWAIGASLIASNISAEHFIGMSGSGFAIGLAISAYEWMAAGTLILVAIFIIPVYLRNRIYTMPQFLSIRYNDQVSSVMAIFWLLVYVFVNLTSILYLGSLAIAAISGIPFGWCIVVLALFSLVVTIGGMKVIGYTDVIQVIVLLAGGLVTTYLALTLLSEKFGFGNDILKALQVMYEEAPRHFDLIFSPSDPHYNELPGLSVLIGGMLVNNLAYWGCNQYIVQRALGTDLPTARKGILFAAFLKLLIPIIAVLPGIAMFVMHQQGMFQQEMTDSGVLKPDHAYPTLMNLLPSGLKGVAFAALTAAIVASLAGKANSIATIYALDIHKKFIAPATPDKQLVAIGRKAVWVSLLIAAWVTPALRSLSQAYQFIQEYVGFVSPGVLAIFLLGMYWKKTTARAALIGALITIPVSVCLKFLPDLTSGALPAIPFLNRMLITFFIVSSTMWGITQWFSPGRAEGNPLALEKADFKVSRGFLAGSIIIFGILAALYTVFW